MRCNGKIYEVRQNGEIQKDMQKGCVFTDEVIFKFKCLFYLISKRQKCTNNLMGSTNFSHTEAQEFNMQTGGHTYLMVLSI